MLEYERLAAIEWERTRPEREALEAERRKQIKPISREAIFHDRTGEMLARFRETVQRLTEHQEKAMADSILNPSR
jgi:hypothetical protein